MSDDIDHLLFTQHINEAYAPVNFCHHLDNLKHNSNQFKVDQVYFDDIQRRKTGLIWHWTFCKGVKGVRKIPFDFEVEVVSSLFKMSSSISFLQPINFFHLSFRPPSLQMDPPCFIEVAQEIENSFQ